MFFVCGLVLLFWNVGYGIGLFLILLVILVGCWAGFLVLVWLLFNFCFDWLSWSEVLVFVVICCVFDLAFGFGVWFILVDFAFVAFDLILLVGFVVCEFGFLLGFVICVFCFCELLFFVCLVYLIYLWFGCLWAYGILDLLVCYWLCCLSLLRDFLLVWYWLWLSRVCVCFDWFFGCWLICLLWAWVLICVGLFWVWVLCWLSWGWFWWFIVLLGLLLFFSLGGLFDVYFIGGLV